MNARTNLRIVRISERCYPHPGGKEVHVLELSRRQASRGHDVRLLYRSGDAPSSGVHAVRIDVGRLSRRDRRLQTAAFLARSVAYVVRNRHALDVAQFHGDYLEAMGAGVTRAFGVPSILTLHGGLSARVLSKIGRVYRCPSHIIVVSESIRVQLTAVGVKNARITVQPSGVNTDVFRPAPSIPETPFTAVSVGSLIPLKDVGSVIQAVRRVALRGIPIDLHVVGDGPEREHLRSSAPPFVHFHGSKSRPELARILRRSHVSVLASVDTGTAGEGTPTSLMEGLACGLPFIATDVGGVPTLAQRSGAGIVVPQRDPHALASALEALATNDGAYAERRAAALAFAHHLDWESVVARIDAVYRRVVKGRGG